MEGLSSSCLWWSYLPVSIGINASVGEMFGPPRRKGSRTTRHGIDYLPHYLCGLKWSEEAPRNFDAGFFSRWDMHIQLVSGNY